MAGSEKDRKNPNRIRAAYLINIIFLSILVLLISACALFLFLRLRQTTERIDAMNRELAADSATDKTLYSDEQVEAIREETAASASAEERRALLQEIQFSLESGESTTQMLRKLFPENFVVRNGEKYYFYPIQPNVRTSYFETDDFAIGGDGRAFYKGSLSGVTTENGIDVSEKNGEIDWPAVAGDGISFAFIRLGGRGADGTPALDTMFEQNLLGAHDAGLSTGVYYQMSAISVEEARADARFIIDALADKRDLLTGPVAVTVTQPAADSRAAGQSRNAWTNHVTAFAEELRAEGLETVIYGNAVSFSMIVDISKLEDCDRWIADHSGSLYFPYRFLYWQYAPNGTVQGIEGDVHMDLKVMKDGA